MSTPQPAPQLTAHPDGALTRHDFLYAGEWQQESFLGQRMHLVRDGELTWSWVMPWEGEFGDISLMPDGEILFAWYGGVARITTDGSARWIWTAPSGTEVHTCQPVGDDSVLVVANGAPATAILLRTTDRAVLWTRILPSGGGNRHGMFRHCRLATDGDLVVGHMDLGRVVRYDPDMRPVLTIETPSPWAAVPLSSGGYLVSGDSAGYVAEFDETGQETWRFDRDDARAAGIELFSVQQAQRLRNGNTVIANWSGNHLRDGERAGTAQLVEISPGGDVAWALSAWESPDLGVASNIHILGDSLGSPMSDR